MIAGGRGGYCFEQNMLRRAGLLALGFTVTSLIALVIPPQAPDAPVYATHMVLPVDFPEGPFLADVGYGALTPVAARSRCLRPAGIRNACCRAAYRADWRAASSAG